MTQLAHTSSRRLRVLLMALSALLAGCGKAKSPEDAKPDASAAKSDMAGMSRKSAEDGEKKGEEKDRAGTSPVSEITFSAAQVQHGGVRWGPVTMGSAAGTASVPGELTVNEDRTARLGAPGRGRIIAVRVQPGDRVSNGQVLVTMQSADAGMAQSDVSKAAAEVTSRRAQAQYASSARARAERLLALKAIPRQDYDRAIADDEQARAALQQAEAELRRSRSTANLMGASGASVSGEVVLRSPLSGVVLARPAQPGAVVDAGAPLVTVTDPSTLWLQMKASEQLSPLFRRGSPLRFTVPAYPTDNFTARTDAVGAGLDPDTRTLAVRGVVPNANGRLKPEMLATVLVDGGQRTTAALVPEAAVQLLDGKPVVFIARPDAKGGARLERREVEVGSRANGQVAVLRGLASGDVIVITGAFAVKAEFQKSAMPKMEM